MEIVKVDMLFFCNNMVYVLIFDFMRLDIDNFGVFLVELLFLILVVSF